MLLAAAAVVAGACGSGADALDSSTVGPETGAEQVAAAGATDLDPAAPLPSEAPPVQGFRLPEDTLLALESEGQEVELLQEALLALGYEPGAADGRFTAKTERALRAFQRDQELDVDGIVGPNTAAAINRALAELSGVGGGSG